MSAGARQSAPRRDAALVWAAAFVLFSAYALWMGEDVNWDLRNYHDYAAHALLRGRHALDVAPAGIQGYFNPLPYLPSYALRHALPAPLAAIGTAAIQALTAVAAWGLAGALVPGRPLRLLATVTALGGAMAVSEVGTSFADLALAAPVLWGLLALLRAWAGGDRRLFLLSGLLVGLAAGLKPTNLVFAAGLAAATLLPWRGMAATAAATWRVAAGGLAGLLLGGGGWAAYLWITLGNPVFPAMNGLFRAPSANPDSFADTRFLPANLGEALLYPWRIAAGAHPTAEFPSADPRLLLALPLCILALTGLRALDDAARRMMAFLAAATIPWLLGFAIHRYAIVLDAVAGLLLVAVPAALLPRRAGGAAALAAAALALALTRLPDWDHRPWGAADPAPPAALREPAAILVAAHPVGHWVSRLPPGSRFVALTDTGLATGGVLRERIAAVLRDPPGGRLWTLSPDLAMEASTRARLAEHGVVPTGPCLRAADLHGPPALFCRAAPVGPRRLAAPDLAPGRSVDFTDRGDGWTLLVAPSPPAPPGWAAPGPEGTPAADGARLVLRPAASPAPLVLEALLRDPPPGARLLLLPDGGATGRRRGDAVALCLPFDDPAGDGVVEIALHDPEGAGLVLRRLALRAAGPGECPG